MGRFTRRFGAGQGHHPADQRLAQRRLAGLAGGIPQQRFDSGLGEALLPAPHRRSANPGALGDRRGRSIYPIPRCTRWSLNNGAARRLTRYGPAVYFPGNNSNEVETADGNPILFASGEPYTIALLILWTEDPGNEGIFRSGSANTGDWLWMTSGGKLWGRHANANSPASSNGPLITAGWHALVRVWDGQEVRQYLDGLRTNTSAVTATGSWSLYRFGYQFTGSEALDEAYVPFFGAFGAAWDDAMVARWSANPLAMLWPEMDTAFMTTGGGGAPPAIRRPVVIIVAG